MNVVSWLYKLFASLFWSQVNHSSLPELITAEYATSKRSSIPRLHGNCTEPHYVQTYAWWNVANCQRNLFLSNTVRWFLYKTWHHYSNIVILATPYQWSIKEWTASELVNCEEMICFTQVWCGRGSFIISWFWCQLILDAPFILWLIHTDDYTPRC